MQLIQVKLSIYFRKFQNAQSVLQKNYWFLIILLFMQTRVVIKLLSDLGVLEK